MIKQLAAVALAAAAFAACEPNRDDITEPQGSFLRVAEREGDNVSGAVYTISNQVTGNAVVVFARAGDGTLTPAGSFGTGGTGTGASLGSQGAVTLSDDGRLLFAVNAGSNDVSVFRVNPEGLSLLSRTPSGGTLPASVTVSRNVAYVLNTGGAGNISGFTVGSSGGLTPIAGSTKSLSTATAGPAEVSFSPDGRQLVVTEKGTSLLDVYPVDKNGVAGERTSYTS